MPNACTALYTQRKYILLKNVFQTQIYCIVTVLYVTVKEYRKY